MMKAAARSKTRLVEQIGPRATAAAQLLLDCALEDLAMWPGAICLAPAAGDEAEAVQSLQADAVVVQTGENLGERINNVNAELADLGYERQIFIGIDCPAIDDVYLEQAAAALQENTAVFGPAADGGVVLMGVRGRWPDLAELPWSTDLLFDALYGTCARAGASVELLAPLRDVDTLEDLLALRGQLEGDSRPARRSLVQWLTQQTDLSPR
jgi:uncharacterized protein